MEALALARPVIATFVAGIPELVRPGETGWLVPAGDVDQLTAAMREMLDASIEDLRGWAGRARNGSPANTTRRSRRASSLALIDAAGDAN